MQSLHIWDKNQNFDNTENYFKRSNLLENFINEIMQKNNIITITVTEIVNNNASRVIIISEPINL